MHRSVGFIVLGKYESKDVRRYVSTKLSRLDDVVSGTLSR